MSIVVTELAGGQTSTDGTQIVTGVLGVAMNVPVVLFVMNTKGASPDTPVPVDDAAGGSNSYSTVRTKDWASTGTATKHSCCFLMIPKATESITMTIGFGGNTQTAFWHSALTLTGADWIGTIVQHIATTNAVSDTLGTAGPLTLASSFVDPVQNALLYFCGINSNAAMTKQASQTQIRETGTTTPIMHGLACYQIGENLSPTCSWVGNVAHYAVAMEIKALTGLSSPLPLLQEHGLSV